MAYDGTGKWTPENDSVQAKVTGLVSQNSPLMKQARTQAKQYSNRRGLLNSSMAAGAGVDAALKSALPIASQDASQTNQKNITVMGLSSQERISDMNVSAYDRRYAISAMADQSKTNLAGWSEVMKNNSLSAADRTKYYEHLQATLGRDKGIVQQMYGITLNW